MEKEDQVVSLEFAKKLEKLGVKQESLFYWLNIHEDEEDKDEYPDEWILIPSAQRGAGSFYSAFTVAELGEMLPTVVKKDEKLYYIQCNANGNSLRYMDYTTYDTNGIGTFLRAYPLVEANTEANARAKTLIYLLENNLIEIKKTP